MQLTTILLALTTLATTTLATSPLPSNTHIRINTEPRLAIAKSRVSSSLARSPIEAAEAIKTVRAATNANTDEDDHAALHHLSNAIRDASTSAAKGRSGIRGMSRRGGRGTVVEKGERRAEEVEKRGGEVVGRGTGMGKAARVRMRATKAERQQEPRQRRERKFMSAKW